MRIAQRFGRGSKGNPDGAGEHMPRVRTTVAVVAVFLSMLAWYLTYRQVQIAERASHVQTWQYLGTQDADITKLFVEHPELRPYFFLRKQLLPTDENFQRVMAMADLHLTLMDSFDDDFVAALPGMEPGGKYEVLWDAYFKGLFRTSSVLCTRYQQTRDVYAAGLSRFAGKACAAHPTN